MVFDPANLDTNIFRKVLTNNLNVQNEKLLIVGDKGLNGSQVSPLLTEQYELAAKELGLDYEVFYKSVTSCGGVDNQLSKQIKNLPDASVILVNMSQKIGRMDELLSFRKYCKERKHRFASSSNLAAISTSQIAHILNAYQANYKDMLLRSERVKAMLDQAETASITSSSGTDISVDVKGMSAVINSGIYRNPGDGGNLPAGEVYIPPTLNGVNGTIVIDGSFRGKDGSSLISDPVSLTIKDGSVISVEGGKEAIALQNTLSWAVKEAERPESTLKIGELGIGINDKAAMVGCTVVDEKLLGTCHFAIGSNAWFGGPVKARIHLDQVLLKPKIFIDGKRFLL